MKYDRIYIVIIVLLACIIALEGCKSRKDLTRTVTDQTRIERTETAIDTSRTIISDQETYSSKADESEEIYTRTQSLDSMGNIRSIQETWRAIGRTKLDLYERAGSHLSLNGMSVVTTDSDSSLTVSNEKQEISADSRPVQGIEWIWVIVGVGVVVFIIIIVILKK